MYQESALKAVAEFSNIRPDIEDLPESEVVQHWLTVLTGPFHVEQEVPGISEGGKHYRLDMLLHPQFDWPSGGRHPIGFEIKRLQPSIARFTKALAQASDYARATWHSPLVGPVKVYVAIYDLYTPWLDRQAQLLAERLAGRLNVGLIRPSDHLGVTLETSGELRWSARRGVTNAAFSAIPKDGSR